jgi:hypothetical protein
VPEALAVGWECNMPNNHEIFVKHLQTIFGEESEIHKAKVSDNRLPVSVFIYKNIPEVGMITGITYGLSLYPFPDWKYGRPEIIISVKSLDIGWPCATATFVADFRGKKRFSYGDVFTTDVPLVSDSKMDGFLIFAQSILDTNLQTVQTNDYKIHFSQFYPIYRSELKIYEKIGLERFWKHPGFDMYDIKRKPITE